MRLASPRLSVHVNTPRATDSLAVVSASLRRWRVGETHSQDYKVEWPNRWLAQFCGIFGFPAPL